jgi:hypothetical protein
MDDRTGHAQDDDDPDLHAHRDPVASTGDGPDQHEGGVIAGPRRGGAGRDADRRGSSGAQHHPCRPDA